MYKIFGNVMKNPIAVIVAIILILVLVSTMFRYLGSIASIFGYETKEQIELRLHKTEAELDKLNKLIKDNKESYEKEKEIDKKNKERLEKELSDYNRLKDEESNVLDDIEKSPNRVISTTENQKKTLLSIMDRNNKFKGKTK